MKILHTQGKAKQSHRETVLSCAPVISSTLLLFHNTGFPEEVRAIKFSPQVMHLRIQHPNTLSEPHEQEAGVSIVTSHSKKHSLTIPDQPLLMPVLI